MAVEIEQVERVKRSETDTGGVDVALKSLNGNMLIEFDKPVTKLSLTIEDLTALIMGLTEGGLHIMAQAKRGIKPTAMN